MADEQKFTPTETGDNGVVSLDPTDAAITAVGKQPWAQEAGMATPGTDLTPENTDNTDEVITKGTDTTEYTNTDLPHHVSVMEDSGMGTWSGPPVESEESTPDTVQPEGSSVTNWDVKPGDIKTLEHFGDTVDNRTAADMPSIPTGDLYMPEVSKTTTPPISTTPVTTTVGIPSSETTAVPTTIQMPTIVPGPTE